MLGSLRMTVKTVIALKVEQFRGLWGSSGQANSMR